MSLYSHLSPDAQRLYNLRKLKKKATKSNKAPIWPDDPIQWIEDNFYLYDRRELVKLETCQKLLLREALRRDEDGKFIYSTVIWSWPKKSAKSTTVAAVAQLRAAHMNYGQIALIGNDLKQADSRVGEFLRESIKQGGRVKASVNRSGYNIKFGNGTIIEMLPIDPAGEAGGNHDMIVYSELWGWKSKKHEQMWTEVTLPVTRVGYSQRWVDTYAGFTGESPVLERLYEANVKEEYQLDPALFGGVSVYANAETSTLCVWANDWHMSWQKTESAKSYYLQEAQNLSTTEFNRIHRNEWSTSSEKFIDPVWWNACKGDTADPAAGQIVLGLDAAVTGDSFAVVGVQPNRINYGTHDEYLKCDVVYSREWTPPGKSSMLSEIQFDQIKKEIIRLCMSYNVVCLAYDPHEMAYMSQQLARENIVHLHKFGQTSPRNESDKMLRDMIINRKIVHSGDEALTAHIGNAHLKITGDSKMRIVKGKDHKKKVDLAVALSMAVYVSSIKNLG